MRQLKISKQVTNREFLSLDKYLQEIGKLDLLTSEEEVSLARRIKLGDQIALDRLIKGNLRFVVSVAKQYQNQGLSLPDLINEGNIGLVKAAQRFDETRGFKFISYAVWWIRQSILQAMADKARLIRIPLNRIGDINKINKETIHFEQINHREPSNKELSQILDISQDLVDSTMVITRHPISIDAPIQDDNEKSNTLTDILMYNDLSSPEDSLLHESLRIDIERSLSTLPDREGDIIRYYYGFDGIHTHTLDEIGKKMGLTRERVRQLKEKGMRKLRNKPTRKQLKNYL